MIFKMKVIEREYQYLILRMTEGEGHWIIAFGLFNLKRSNELVGVLMVSSEDSSLSLSGQKAKPYVGTRKLSKLGFLFHFWNLFRIKDFFIQLL